MSLYLNVKNALSGILNPTTPARVIGTAFQVSATRPSFVTYTIGITVQSTLIAGQSHIVQLMSDAVNPPTTIRAEARNALFQLIGLTVTMQNIVEIPITYMVPAGHFVRLVASGTGSSSIVRQTEVIL